MPPPSLVFLLPVRGDRMERDVASHMNTAFDIHHSFFDEINFSSASIDRVIFNFLPRIFQHVR